MAKVKMTRGKFEGINACAARNGVIAAAAMDQRGSLKKAIAKARGEGGQADSHASGRLLRSGPLGTRQDHCSGAPGDEPGAL